MIRSASPSLMHRFSVATLACEPWRNGGGVTRTVACGGDDSALGWDWRVSIADITQSGPFSRYPGIDRDLVLIGGGPLVLHGAAASLRLDGVGEQVQFSGDLRMSAELDAKPARMWNVMTRRGVARCTLRLSTTPRTECAATNARSHILLLVIDGRQRLLASGASHIDLRPGDGLWVAPQQPGLTLQAMEPHSRVLVTEMGC